MSFTFTRIAKELAIAIIKMEEVKASKDNWYEEMEAVKRAATIRPRDWSKMIRELEEAETDMPEWGSTQEDHEAYHASQKHLDSVRGSLRDVLTYAPWGANGSVFVTSRSRGFGHGDQTRTLHLNGRARLSLLGRLKVIPADEAEKTFQEKKVSSRTVEVNYQALRAEVITELIESKHNQLESFSGWTFHYGQCGGFFSRSHKDWCYADNVSALGALCGAWGKDWETNPVNQEWVIWEESRKTQNEGGNTLPDIVPDSEQTSVDIASADLSKLFGGAVKHSH